MSAEQEELRQLARAERAIAWQSMKRLPGRAGDTVSAFARQHPFLAMGSSAAIAMGLVAKKRSASRKVAMQNGVDPDREGQSLSWSAALAAVGAQLLPQALKFAGLTVQDALQDQPDDDDQPLADQAPDHEAGSSRVPINGSAPHVGDEDQPARPGADTTWQKQAHSRI